MALPQRKNILEHVFLASKCTTVACDSRELPVKTFIWEFDLKSKN